MKKALERLIQSGTHLEAIEEFFIKEVPEYRRQEDQLGKLGRFYDEFSRQLYAGGRKEGRHDQGNRFHRGLMLADLLTYAVFCRGSFIAVASDDHRAAFKEIVLRIVNKLLLQENISTDPKLRKELLKSLESCGIGNFFEDKEQEDKFRQLVKFNGPIVWGESGTNHYKTMDAVLPKSRGLAIEFLIYLYLIHRDFGFVVPLLLQQRLFASSDTIAPPDFLLLKPDGRCFAVEVGFTKEGQSTKFVTKTSLPTVVAELDDDQPFRCPECGKWITYCDRVIEDYSKGVSTCEPLLCTNCKYFDNGKCKDIILFAKEPGNSGQRRYHYNCVSAKPWVKNAEKAKIKDQMKVWYPTASIIDALVDKS